MQEKQINLDDPKVTAILYAAFDAFRMYGYRRTSMEDIARGAGMSRAALYLHFKNKEEIFRSMVGGYYAQAVEAARAALAVPGGAAERLQAAFEAQTGEGYRQMLESPHGEELMDSKHAVAGAAAAQELAPPRRQPQGGAGGGLRGVAGTRGGGGADHAGAVRRRCGGNRAHHACGALRAEVRQPALSGVLHRPRPAGGPVRPRAVRFCLTGRTLYCRARDPLSRRRISGAKRQFSCCSRPRAAALPGFLIR